jgi:hypothetical protein
MVEVVSFAPFCARSLETAGETGFSFVRPARFRVARSTDGRWIIGAGTQLVLEAVPGNAALAPGCVMPRRAARC